MPEIERKIWVIKEWVRAVVYSLPVNALPAVVLVNAVLFVTKQLNLFPVKGGISTRFSPKQIMTGKVVHYKFAPFLLANTVRFWKRDIRGMVSEHGHRVPLHLDPVVMSRGGIKFTL